MTTEPPLTRTQYWNEIRDMAEYVLEQMRHSSAETREEWDEEWGEYVWLAVENCTLRYDERNHPSIIEYSASALDSRHFDEQAQQVREMMEDDVRTLMEGLPLRGVTPPSP